MRYWIFLASAWAVSASLWAVAALSTDTDPWNNYGTVALAMVTVLWGAFEAGRSRR